MENIALIAIVVLIIILALVFMLMRRNQADADVFEDEPLLPSKTEHQFCHGKSANTHGFSRAKRAIATVWRGG